MTIAAGLGEGPSGFLDTPATITAAGVTEFFSTVSVVSGGVAAVLNSYGQGNSSAARNFAASQLASLAATAAYSDLPMIKPWAKRIGDLAERAAQLATKVKEACP